MTLDTSFVIVLTDPDPIALIQIGTSITQIMQMKADKLHQEMIHQGWMDEQLKKPGGRSYRNMKELHEMVQKKFLEMKEVQVEKIRDEIARKLDCPPPLPLLKSSPNDDERSSDFSEESESLSEGMEEDEVIYNVDEICQEIEREEQEKREREAAKGEESDESMEEERSQEILFEAIGEDLLHHKTLSTDFYEIQSQALQDIHAPRLLRARNPRRADEGESN